MVRIECNQCRWRGTFPGVDHITCDYCWITGKVKAKLPPREDGICPAFEEGEQARIEVRPMDNPFRAVYIKGQKVTHEELMALYQKGLTDGEIAREVGSVKSTIYNWRHRNGLPPNGKMQDSASKYDYKVFRELWEQGLSDTKIARVAGCAASTVSRWRTLEGLKSKGLSGSAPILDRRKMRELYDAGLSDAKIAQEIGCNASTISKWRIRENLLPNGVKNAWSLSTGRRTGTG